MSAQIGKEISNPNGTVLLLTSAIVSYGTRTDGGVYETQIQTPAGVWRTAEVSLTENKGFAVAVSTGEVYVFLRYHGSYCSVAETREDITHELDSESSQIIQAMVNQYYELREELKDF